MILKEIIYGEWYIPRKRQERMVSEKADKKERKKGQNSRSRNSGEKVEREDSGKRKGKFDVGENQESENQKIFILFREGIG